MKPFQNGAACCTNSVMPDITVIAQSRIFQQNAAVAGAPDWIIEILSPEQSTTKLIAKIQTCLQEGTQLGWLLDSAELIIPVLLPNSQMRLLWRTAPLPVLPDIALSLTVDRVFGWLNRSATHS